MVLRPPMIQKVCLWMTSECGKDEANRIFNNNPSRMLNNQEINSADSIMNQEEPSLEKSAHEL